MSWANKKARIKGLFIYPIKSCGVVELKEMSIGPGGPFFDRQWMLVDEQNQFLTQRQWPQLARVALALDSERLKIQIENSIFEIPILSSADESQSLRVKVWKDEVQASVEDQKMNQAFSEFLHQPVRLVQFRDFSKRPVSSTRSGFETHVRFADSRPLLLTNTKSLELFNSWMTEPVPMSRFRANVVVEASAAFEEDHWSRWQSEEVVFSQPQMCSRCVMINVDQTSGEIPSSSPLKTLAAQRKINGKAMFGMHFTPEQSGVLKLGTEVQVAITGTATL